MQCLWLGPQLSVRLGEMSGYKRYLLSAQV